MLRAVLGVCGVSLIAFGVFGGQTLENMHSGISGLFTPDTVVENVARSADPVSLTEPVPVTETVIASSTGKEDASELVVAAAADARKLPKPTVEVAKVLEIQSSSKPADTEILPAALTKEVPAGSLATASIAIPEVATKPVTTTSKEEGVEIVLNSTTGAPPNDTLFVLKERVNLREGPSTNHPVVLQLDKGQELMEFKRDGRWVHVGAYGTAGKIGWVHRTLVGGASTL